MTPDKEKDKAAVRKWVETYLSYNNKGETPWKLEEVYTEDMVFLPPNMAPIKGITATKNWMEPSYGLYNLASEVIEMEIKTDSDMAYVYLSAKDTFTPKACGESMETENKCIWILNRMSDGSWKGTHCIWNSSLP